MNIAKKWKGFYADHLSRMLASHDRKCIGRQVVEALMLLWWYRYLPVEYWKYGMYLKTAPSRWRCLVPHRFVKDLREKLNPIEGRRTAKDKRAFRERMEIHGLPVVRECFTIDSEGVVRDPAGELLAYEDAAARIGEGGFAKPVGGLKGIGARLILPEDDAEAFVKTARNVIVQPRIRQHRLLEDLAPRSVNTVRIDTCRCGDRWVSSAAVLKAGIGNSVVDNLAAGGLVVGIDLETGRLEPIGRRMPNLGTGIYDRHPDTNVLFKDFVVPHWELLRATVARAAEAMLPLQTLGWDVVIIEDGVLLLEANCDWGSDIFQIALGGLAHTPVGRMCCNLRGLKPPRCA